MSDSPVLLHMICGKIASGKSTLACEIARDEGALALIEDDWLRALYAHEMQSAQYFMRCSAKLRMVIGPHVVQLLQLGVSVVLDFQANTLESRLWMRELFEKARVAHCLHVVNVPDEICLGRLRARNAGGDHPFAATEAQYWQISKHVVLPTSKEGFDAVEHDALHCRP